MFLTFLIWLIFFRLLLNPEVQYKSWSTVGEWLLEIRIPHHGCTLERTNFEQLPLNSAALQLSQMRGQKCIH